MRTICRPTENVDKVMKSMLNIFPDLQIEQQDEELVGTGQSIDLLEEILRNQRIRSAARKVFHNSVDGNKLTFRLNKQVAYVGKVNFAERSPLGDIEVTIEDDNLMVLIDRIAPGPPEE
ncbi:MAG: hypothetical protein KAW09_00530 [Thermoplasmata archaeon]|nr:hypothetical protein [Thermoplasmata archaeon]